MLDFHTCDQRIGGLSNATSIHILLTGTQLLCYTIEFLNIEVY